MRHQITSMYKSTTIDRYPGLRPFEEAEKSMFFGRAIELEELSQAININDLFVIHGESGLGKSSLINAGLIPMLREREYYPILIRFKEKSKSPLQQVTQEVKKLMKEHGIDDIAGSEERLWVFIKLLNSKKLKPILIFDQFEEFSYFNVDDRLKLVKELASLLSSKIPDYGRGITWKSEPDSSFSWYAQPEVKLLFSLRSDRISILEDFSELMPAMLRSRYQLKPIKLGQVEQIVVMPGVMESFGHIQFNSQPFQYQPALINDVIEVVKDKKRETVETTQLQMICQEIEGLVKERQDAGEKDILVTQADLSREKLEELVNNFYKKQLDKIRKTPEVSADEFSAIRILLEKRLLNQKKRIPLAEATVFQHFTEYFKDRTPITDDKIRFIRDLLLSLRLIRDQTYGDALFYELSHDTLVEPINTAMTDRETEEALKRATEERRKQELELLKQRRDYENTKKNLEEIQKQRERAEHALKDLEVAVHKQKEQTQIAEYALQAARDAQAKEKKTRDRLARMVGGFVIGAFILLIVAVVWLDSKNKTSNNLLARVYRNEARMVYDLGNHQLAYRYWKDAKDKSSDNEVSKEVDDYLKNNVFAAFAGESVMVSPDGNYVATKFTDDSWHLWDVSGSKVALKMSTLPKEHLELFYSRNYYSIIDTNNHIKIFSLQGGKEISFRDEYINLDTMKVSDIYPIGDYFYVKPLKGYSTFFSLKTRKSLREVNKFIWHYSDSSEDMNRMNARVGFTQVWPIDTSGLYLYRFDEQHFLINLAEDKVERFPRPLNITFFSMYRNKLVFLNRDSVMLFDIKSKSLSLITNKFIPEQDEYIGFANSGKYFFGKRKYKEGGFQWFGYNLDNARIPSFSGRNSELAIFAEAPYIAFQDSTGNVQVQDLRTGRVIDVINSVNRFFASPTDSTLLYSLKDSAGWHLKDLRTMETQSFSASSRPDFDRKHHISFNRDGNTGFYNYLTRQQVTVPFNENMQGVDMVSDKFIRVSAIVKTVSSQDRVGLTYLLFADSTLRIQSNLQQYFEPYLDNVMKQFKK